MAHRWHTWNTAYLRHHISTTTGMSLRHLFSRRCMTRRDPSQKKSLEGVANVRASRRILTACMRLVRVGVWFVMMPWRELLICCARAPIGDRVCWWGPWRGQKKRSGEPRLLVVPSPSFGLFVGPSSAFAARFVKMGNARCSLSHSYEDDPRRNGRSLSHFYEDHPRRNRYMTEK